MREFMKEGFFHECEVKYHLDTPIERKKLEKVVQGAGFAFEGRQLETDFLPDTEDYLCRENGILLRFRRILSRDDSDILLTLKVKGDSTEFQEHFELEYRFSHVEEDTLERINQILEKATGRTLPSSIHEYDAAHFDDLIDQVKTLFPAHRILLEKKRDTYTRGNNHALFDTLPEGIGDYLELESSSLEELTALVSELPLDAMYVEPLDYGDILKRHKQGMPDQIARTGLFSEEERKI